MLPFFFLLPKPPLKSLLLSVSVALLLSASTQAVTQVYEIWTEAAGNRETYNQSSGGISSVQVLEYNNQKNGSIRSEATNMTFADLGDGNFSYTSAEAQAPFGHAAANIAEVNTVSETPTVTAKAKVKVNAGSAVTFTVTFDLAVNEVKQANLDLNYTIEISGKQSAEVRWGLTKEEDANWLGLSGSDTQNTTGSKTTSQSIELNQAGTYTLTMTAEVPLQDFNNAQKTASSTLDAVYFEVVAVPEPSSTALLTLSLSGFLFQRRR